MAGIRKTLLLRDIARVDYEQLRKRKGFKNKEDFEEPPDEGYAEIVQPLRYPTFEDVLRAFMDEGLLGLINIPRGPKQHTRSGIQRITSEAELPVYACTAKSRGCLYIYFSEKEPPHRIGFDARGSAVVSTSVMFPGSERHCYGWESNVPQAYRLIRGLWAPDT